MEWTFSAIPIEMDVIQFLNKKTKHCIDDRSFKEYLYQQFILFRSEDQEKEEPNQHHGRFLFTLKIKDGTDYEPPGVTYVQQLYGHQSATASTLATGQWPVTAAGDALKYFSFSSR